MNLVGLFTLLALFTLYAPLEVDMQPRAYLAAFFAVAGLLAYLRHKLALWRAAGQEPGAVLQGRLVGAILGASGGVVGGLVGAFTLPGTSFEEKLSRAYIEVLGGLFYGVMLGLSVGVSAKETDHTLAGAVTGGFGGGAGGAMAALSPGASSRDILVSGAVGLIVGAAVGSAVGKGFAPLRRAFRELIHGADAEAHE